MEISGFCLCSLHFEEGHQIIINYVYIYEAIYEEVQARILIKGQISVCPEFFPELKLLSSTLIAAHCSRGGL